MENLPFVFRAILAILSWFLLDVLFLIFISRFHHRLDKETKAERWEKYK